MKTIRSALSRDQTDRVKGVFAFAVLLSHIRNNMAVLNGTLIGQILTNLAYLAVGVFFFLSGYGLLRQYRSRGEDYLDGFLCRRVLSTFLIMALVIVMKAGYQYLLFREFDWKLCLRSFLFGKTALAYGWFFQAILLLYLLFYLVYLFASRASLRIVLIALGMIGYVALSMLLSDQPSLYYNSVFCFPLGLLTARLSEDERMELWLEKRWGLVFPALILAFLAAALLGNLRTLPDSVRLPVKAASCVFFSGALVLLLQRIDLSGALTRKAGKLYLALYVSQEFSIPLLRGPVVTVENDWLYCLLTIALSVMIAIPLQTLFQAVQRLCQGARKP